MELTTEFKKCIYTSGQAVCTIDSNSIQFHLMRLHTSASNLSFLKALSLPHNAASNYQLAIGTTILMSAARNPKLE